MIYKEDQRFTVEVTIWQLENLKCMPTKAAGTDSARGPKRRDHRGARELWLQGILSERDREREEECTHGRSGGSKGIVPFLNLHIFLTDLFRYRGIAERVFRAPAHEIIFSCPRSLLPLFNAPEEART